MPTREVALLGAGRMGAALVDRWSAAGRPVVVWNRTPETARALEGAGVRAADSLAVLGREVGDTGREATGWGFAFECGVGSSVVVAVEEGLEGSGTFGVG